MVKIYGTQTGGDTQIREHMIGPTHFFIPDNIPHKSWLFFPSDTEDTTFCTVWHSEDNPVVLHLTLEDVAKWRKICFIPSGFKRWVYSFYHENGDEDETLVDKSCRYKWVKFRSDIWFAVKHIVAISTHCATMLMMTMMTNLGWWWWCWKCSSMKQHWIFCKICPHCITWEDCICISPTYSACRWTTMHII